MVSTAMIAEIAALAGDPARAAMLNTLMDGRALTATELASVAGITPQTASGHLARLTTAGLLAVEKQGRHRYHRLASQAIAQMIESISQVASTLEPPRRNLSTGPRDLALRAARTCYDHLAGRLGVALADALLDAGHAEIDGDAGEVTDSGLALFAALGVDLDRSPGRGGRRSTRVFCRPCLDWSERRPHLAGAVGAAICTHSFERGWIRRVEGSRAVSVTPKGRLALRDAFGVRLD
ncbi:MAG: helix-turn-helix transcriptional regulator [Thalassobaculum sp.]|uniref:ArsR/SmtB family transcription factor n=1 Tax=Thalassobaculum sp. TaxID=2022740 RepID=UPI0032EDBDD1